MGVAVPVEAERIYSREEFRQWYERQGSGRYERIDGRIVAMAPERGAHLRVKAAGVACHALPDGATIESSESAYDWGVTVLTTLPAASRN